MREVREREAIGIERQREIVGERRKERERKREKEREVREREAIGIERQREIVGEREGKREKERERKGREVRLSSRWNPFPSR